MNFESEVERRCERCGTAFPRNRIGRPKLFCSRACQRAAAKEDYSLRGTASSSCAQCSVAIKQPTTGRLRHFCSDGCRKAWGTTNSKRLAPLVRQFIRAGETANKLAQAHIVGDIHLTRRHTQEVQATILALLGLLEQTRGLAGETELVQLIEALRDRWDDPWPGDTGL